ncbi:MAG: helix-turn-helix domain-containing protein [Ruminococcus sp.]|nr:helix-turn-helix domain-containing protein [Ruminococcus sp.]MCM1381182.1 helix-turn-helix domain-containing protein [Muribaculaceae bacterium]MCM1478190.1 helix-turn-helix domain-containing protein [Muribaculaceae bacterium]
MSKLPTRLRTLREDSHLTQRQLAEYLGLRQQTYSRYERGELIPSLASMAALADFYDTSVDFLVGVTDNPVRKK